MFLLHKKHLLVFSLVITTIFSAYSIDDAAWRERRAHRRALGKALARAQSTDPRRRALRRKKREDACALVRLAFGFRERR